MKFSLAISLIFAFVLSVLGGYWLSQQYTLQQTQVANKETGSLSIDKSQINLLVVHVKELQVKEPGLQVIWLAAVKPGESTKLISIYPFGNDQTRAEAEILDVFELKRNGSHLDLSPETVAYFQAKGLQWDGTIVLDNQAMGDFADAFGKIKLGEHYLDREQLTTALNTLETSQQDLSFYTFLWREVCWNILHSPVNIPNLSRDFLKHTSAIFSSDMNEQGWVSLLSSVNIPSCEFPMYQPSNP